MPSKHHEMRLLHAESIMARPITQHYTNNTQVQVVHQPFQFLSPTFCAGKSRYRFGMINLK